MFVDEVSWRLLGRDGNKRNAFVRGFEPDNLRFVLLAILLAPVTSIFCTSFGLLFLLCSLAAWAEKAQGTGKHLSRDSFDDCNDMPGIEGLRLVADFLFFHQQETLAFDFYVIILLLGGALSKTAPSPDTPVWRDGLGVTSRS